MKRATMGHWQFSLAIVLALTAASLANLCRADWPQFRGPAGLGISKETGLPASWGPQENVVWKTELPGPGSSSPIVKGEQVLVTCYSGYGVNPERPGDMENLRRHLLCLNRADGKVLWNKIVKAKLPEQPYRSWMVRHGYASSTPAADGQRVYAFFGKSGVFAFDHNGRQLWQAYVGSETHGYGSGASPALHDNLVIVNASSESQALVALDKSSGREVWRARGIRESFNTPLVVDLPGNKTEVVLEYEGEIAGFDPRSGQRLWTCSTGFRDYVCPSLVAHEGVVYSLGGRSGSGLAVRAGGRGNVTQSHLLWKGSKRGPNVPSPLYHQGHLYFANEDNIAFCLNAKTGALVYQQPLKDRAFGGQSYASPVLADGKLYYVSFSGRTFVVAGKPEFEQLATNNLDQGGIFHASPAVAGGRLFLRSDRFLYCIGKKE